MLGPQLRTNLLLACYVLLATHHLLLATRSARTRAPSWAGTASRRARARRRSRRCASQHGTMALLTACYLLPTAYCRLPTADCRLPTTRCVALRQKRHMLATEMARHPDRQRELEDARYGVSRAEGGAATTHRRHRRRAADGGAGGRSPGRAAPSRGARDGGATADGGGDRAQRAAGPERHRARRHHDRTLHEEGGA